MYMNKKQKEKKRINDIKQMKRETSHLKRRESGVLTGLKVMT